MPDLQLVINGTIYRGWEEVSIRRSLDTFADMFDLTLTDDQANSARTIKLGAPCQIKIDDELLITGYIDKIQPRYDAHKRHLTVSGRSKTADLVDCSMSAEQLGGSQLKDQTILQLANYLCAKLKSGITASTDVTDLKPIQVTTPSTEQPFFEFLELYSRSAGVMLNTTPEGNVFITRASSIRLKTALVLGENILKAEGEFNERNRFSDYYLASQMPTSDDVNGPDAAHITGYAQDLISRYRPTTIQMNGLDADQSTRYAKWKRNINYGRSRQATYTVKGWKHAEGLWKPNTNVLVNDPWMGFADANGKGEWLMIGTVRFFLDAGGQRTQLTVMPKEAYDVEPPTSSTGLPF